MYILSCTNEKGKGKRKTSPQTAELPVECIRYTYLIREIIFRRHNQARKRSRRGSCLMPSSTGGVHSTQTASTFSFVPFRPSVLGYSWGIRTENRRQQTPLCRRMVPASKRNVGAVAPVPACRRVHARRLPLLCPSLYIAVN